MANLAYFVDEHGPYAVPAESAAAEVQAGAQPASQQQIAAFQTEDQKQKTYGTTGQQIATGLEGAAQGLTFGLSDYVERGFGVDPEGIRARAEVNPATHATSAIAGAAAPLLLSGGAAAPEEAAALVARGGAEGASALRTAASLTAPAQIARLGRGITSALAPEGAGVLRTLAAKGAAGVAEGAAYSAGDVVHDYATNDPTLTPETAAERILTGGALGGALGGGLGAAEFAGAKALGAVKGKLGDTLPDWLDDFIGERGLKAAGGIQGDVAKLERTLSAKGARAVGRELFDNELVGPFTTPAETAERAAALKAEVGPQINSILADADAVAKPDQMADVAGVFKSVRDGRLADLRKNPGLKDVANKLESLIDDYEEKFGEQFEAARLKAGRMGLGADFTEPYRGKASLENMHELRRQIDDLIPYGKEPADKAYGRALRDIRSAASDEIEKTIKRIGADSEAWTAANRKYQVASIAADFARKGMQRATGNNLVPLTSVLSAIGGGAALGSLPGGLAVGAAGLLSRKFGSGVLGAGARALRGSLGDSAGASLPALAEKYGAANARSVLVQAAAHEPSATAHGIGASSPELALERPPKDVAEGIAPLAMASLLGEDPRSGPGLMHAVGGAVSPRLVEALGEVQAKAYAQAMGTKDDGEVKRLLREAAKLGYGGPFTTAEAMEASAQRGLLRPENEKVRADTAAIADMAAAAKRARVDARLAPLAADVVRAAWSHGSLAAHGAAALKDIRASLGPEAAAAIAPSLRKAVKGPQTGLVPPSDFHEEQAATRNGVNEALGQLGGAPREAAAPETVATLAVLARHADDVAAGVNDAATAVVSGKVPESLRGKPLTSAETLKMMDSVRRLAADPQRLVDELERHTATLGDHAPQTGQAAGNTLSTATQYLASCLPTVRAPTLQDPKPGLPAKSDAAAWARKADAVLHPLQVLAAGPSPDAAAALQAVYPSLWGQWRAGVVMALSSAAAEGKPPSFQTIQRVSTMIGQPLVPAQDPSMLAIMPATPRAPIQQQARPSKAGLGKADFAGALRTGTQEAMVSQ